MEPNSQLPPVSRKKARLDPIAPDIFRRTTTGFGAADNSKAMTALIEENERLKSDLENARKEIFRLKEENLELKKVAKTTKKPASSTFLTSSVGYDQTGDKNEDTKTDSGDIVWHNWNALIAKQSYKLHVIYWEKNFTEWSYWKMKLNRADLDAHIEEELGTFSDLLEAVTKNKLSDIETMYEHGNDIHAIDPTDKSENTLLHVAARNWNKETVEFLIEKGININVRNKNNETPLHHAVAIKDEDRAVVLIESMLLKGADWYAKDKLGDTPFEKAKRSGKSNVLLLFSESSNSRVPTPASSFRK